MCLASHSGSRLQSQSPTRTGGKMKKTLLPQRAGVATVALVAAVAVAAPAVTASAAESRANTESSAAVAPKPKFTVASYTKYLEKRAKKDASARAVLKQFKKLSSAQK